MFFFCSTLYARKIIIFLLGEKYLSMIGYTAENSDELSYGAGEEIEALMKSSYGWWKVR